MTDPVAHLRRVRTDELDARKARFGRWLTKHSPRLAGMHPDVAAEVRSTVADRFMAGAGLALTDADLHQCQMRVASRLRIKRYGACSDDEEAARQLRECVAAIDGSAQQAAA